MKSLLFGLLVLGASSASAQFPADNNNLFNVDAGIIVPYSPGNNSVGFGGYAEPKFNLLNYLAVGIKAEGYVAFGGKIDGVDYGDVSFRMAVMTGTALMVDYIAPLDGNFRPFVGFGFGRYTYASQSVATSTVSVTQEAGTSLGIVPRIGIQLGAFRLSCEYNLLFKESPYVYQQVSVGGAPVTGSLSRNYFGFKLGGVIGWQKAK